VSHQGTNNALLRVQVVTGLWSSCVIICIVRYLGCRISGFLLCIATSQVKKEMYYISKYLRFRRDCDVRDGELT